MNSYQREQAMKVILCCLLTEALKSGDCSSPFGERCAPSGEEWLVVVLGVRLQCFQRFGHWNDSTTAAAWSQRRRCSVWIKTLQRSPAIQLNGYSFPSSYFHFIQSPSNCCPTRDSLLTTTFLLLRKLSQYKEPWGADCLHCAWARAVSDELEHSKQSSISSTSFDC